MNMDNEAPSPTRRSIAINIGSQLVAKAFGAVSTFVITLLFARTFGPSGYGDISKAITYVGFFYLFADFGLNATYIKCAHEPHIYGALLYARLLLSFCLVFIALALLSFLPQSGDFGYTYAVKIGIILFTPTIITQALITTANAYFQQTLRYSLATVATISGSLVSLLATLLIVYGIRTQIAIPIAPVVYVIGGIVTACVSFLLLRGSIGTITFVNKESLSWSIFRASLPLGITLLCNVVYFHADSFIMAVSRSSAEVGAYALSYKIFELPLVFPTFFMNALYPLLVRRLEKQTESYLYILRNSGVFLFFISVCTGILLYIAAPFVLSIHPEFTITVQSLRILSLAMPFFFLSSLYMWNAIAQGKLWQLAGIYGLSMGINICASMWLIPRYGFVAAAWITVVMEGGVCTANYFISRKNTVK